MMKANISVQLKFIKKRITIFVVRIIDGPEIIIDVRITDDASLYYIIRDATSCSH